MVFCIFIKLLGLQENHLLMLIDSLEVVSDLLNFPIHLNHNLLFTVLSAQHPVFEVLKFTIALI